MKRVVLALFVAVTAVGCSSGSESPAATAASTEAVATTISATVKATTTTVAPTTTVDPLEQAFARVGLPFDESLRKDFVAYCGWFADKNVEAMNTAYGRTPEVEKALSTAFRVLCPENQLLLGKIYMPNGEPAFPGYPLIVPVESIDRRVSSWFEGKLVDGQVVALAPGFYTPYNPTVPELAKYMTISGSGDCVVMDTYFPSSGGACWSGVQKGSAEP